ncbi:iron-siderophore ABC transporter substrate-binding protein [Kitasatospora indigofera]|uniref:iron-siderophore ABC transporter substrate-binding protein n=1 Tax=Kitasatospora indigofera TaxID=67307 RepID=UPI00369C0D23
MPPQITRRALLAGLGGAALTACAGPGSGTPTADSATDTPPPAGPRVVTLDTAELDSAMTVGITPVGAARAPADSGLPDYWSASRLAQITLVGEVGSPDTALIRRLKPDLILGSQVRDAAHYETLRRIAPTLLTTTTGHPWKANFQQHAQALGRQAAADAVTAAYQRHTGQVAEALGPSGRRISLVRFVENAPVRLYARQNFLATLLDDVQLSRPDQQNAAQFAVEVPADQIARADGDVLLYAVYGDPDAAGATATLASPGWQALSAVKAHRAFPVSDQLWFQGIGYTGANAVLDELQHLLGA